MIDLCENLGHCWDRAEGESRKGLDDRGKLGEKVSLLEKKSRTGATLRKKKRS